MSQCDFWGFPPLTQRARGLVAADVAGAGRRRALEERELAVSGGAVLGGGVIIVVEIDDDGCLVGQDDVGEDGAFHEFELAALVQNLSTHDV